MKPEWPISYQDLSHVLSGITLNEQKDNKG
jgi:hypothetical protein